MFESHVVRIYRRNEEKPGEVAGLVESIGNEKKLPFKNYAGLVSIMRELIYKDEIHDTVVPLREAGKDSKKKSNAL